jgi:hypothetical protein
MRMDVLVGSCTVKQAAARFTSLTLYSREFECNHAQSIAPATHSLVSGIRCMRADLQGAKRALKQTHTSGLNRM